MKGEERMVCHFYRGNNMACKARAARTSTPAALALRWAASARVSAAAGVRAPVHTAATPLHAPGGAAFSRARHARELQRRQSNVRALH